MNNREHSLMLAKKEWRKESKERKTRYFLLSLAIISFALLGMLFFLNLVKLNGFVNYVSNMAGEITELTITSSIPVNVWGGFYGLVLRVPGFTEIITKDIPSGDIQRTDVFFDCLKLDAQGGPEIYASTNPALNLISSTVVSASKEMIDVYINCSDEVYCAADTFTKNMTIYLGTTKIENITSTYTFKYDGSSDLFDIGALNVSNELVFVAHINATIQKGFNPTSLLNYQMLIPIPANTTPKYYFYPDPFDVCATGGIGNTLNISVEGFVKDEFGQNVENASVSLAGYSVYSNNLGFYNLSALVLEGTYNLVTIKTGFKTSVDQINISFSNASMNQNITLIYEVPSSSIIEVNISGTVKDTGDSPLPEVQVIFGNNSINSSILGDYNFKTAVYLGQNPIFAIKEDYDNYYDVININSSSTNINYDIVMSPANLNPYATGPYTTGPYATGPYAIQKLSNTRQQVQQEIQKAGQDFWISTKEINKQIRRNTFIEEEINVYNFKGSTLNLLFTVSPEIQEILKLSKNTLSVGSNKEDKIIATISGTQPIGVYRGTIKITGGVEQEIYVKIEIVDQNTPIQNMRMELTLLDPNTAPGSDVRYKLNLKNLLRDYPYQVYLKYLIVDSNNTRAFYYTNETVELKDSLDLLRKITLPANFSNGEYQLAVEANYLNLFSTVTAPLTVSTSIYFYSFFGIKLWMIFLTLFIASFILFNLFLYRMHLNKKKRYHLDLELNTLPKPGERSIKLGKLAERSTLAYYNLDDLTTHAIVAGATGGGKSIAAQVFVEEALLKNIAVIVFDPTAQWSGMLRKCDDKGMMSFYPKFGLKPTDAKAFPGNIRPVTNERLSIDIRKYMNPGKIEVFTMNKLTPPQIDIFVAGVISNIFKSDPKEAPNLKVLLVFDEVHRLLPKFGGSGKGFLQIERACREFRKWGLGVMLVSQVLSDFVGEIKANINTEVQMRVAEENDLERIKLRYGDDSLKALVRADVGTGMIQNAEYNKGKPYFVSLRPILHNTRRLTDEVLEKYNKYNQIIEDIDYQLEQIETLKVDTSDLKIEIKLVKDKLMTGNFTVVDIYLEGLIPKLEKTWDKLGKKPKKKVVELINVEELQTALDQAKKARTQWEKTNTSAPTTQATEIKSLKKSEKIVVPFTFNNGMMISSLKELNDTLPSIDKTVIADHVNEDKNEISVWITAQIDPALGAKVKKMLTREEIKQEINKFIESEKTEGKKTEETSKNDSKESPEKDDKKKSN